MNQNNNLVSKVQASKSGWHEWMLSLKHSLTIPEFVADECSWLVWTVLTWMSECLRWLTATSKTNNWQSEALTTHFLVSSFHSQINLWLQYWSRSVAQWSRLRSTELFCCRNNGIVCERLNRKWRETDRRRDQYCQLFR